MGQQEPTITTQPYSSSPLEGPGGLLNPYPYAEIIDSSKDDRQILKDINEENEKINSKGGDEWDWRWFTSPLLVPMGYAAYLKNTYLDAGGMGMPDMDMVQAGDYGDQGGQYILNRLADTAGYVGAAGNLPLNPRRRMF